MDTIKYLNDRFQLEGKQSPIKLPIDRFRGLCSIFKELGFKVGAEVGVNRGKYSKWICIKNKGVKLYCIDPYLAYGDYVECHDKDGQKVMDDCFEQAKTRLKGFNCEFVRKTSMDAVKDFKDESLDFVFIDGNHTFEYAVNDIAEWSKKVRKGGIISGHDYWNSIELSKVWAFVNSREEKMKLCQVKDAVDAWVKTNDIHPWFLVKGPCPSWFWVKK